MADSSDDTSRLQERANTLYWESDESVNRIAEDLGVSKGALYGLVESLPAGLPCPRCSDEMEYPNRTAREKGFLTCPSCELEEDEEEVREEWRDAARTSGAGTLVVEPGSGESARSLCGVGDAAYGNRVILGTALLGAAAGLAVALWVRKK